MLEELEKVVIESEGDKYFQVGVRLPLAKKEELISFLKSSMNVFAWITYEALGNKWTYERSYKSLNLYSFVEYNKIYLNTNSWKTLQEESLWQEDFNNLYFWNTLNKTH